ncbi:MAG: hypothetical protein WBP13_04975 [Methylophilaceae bacterium]
MKNAKKYIKLYEEKAEESFKDWGYYYPPKTWDEFYAWETKSFEKYLKETEDYIKKTKSYVALLGTTKDFGFYIAFQKLDYALLNNVLYQTSRQALLSSGMTASGSDHCNLLLDAITAFACNDFEVIKYFFPKKLRHSKGTYYTEVSVNLLKVLYYQENELKDKALKKAEIFLEAKRSLWEKYVVLYFISLINQNEEEATRCLQELCSAYQKIGYPMSKLDKCFAAEVHGLYRFARIIDENLFNKITQPKHACFSEAFELWQKANHFPKGQLFYRHPEEMDYMNKIFEAELPTVALHNPYSDKREVKDVEKFAIDLTENVKKIV